MDIKIQVQEVLKKFPSLNYDETNNSLYGELFVTKNDSYDIVINIKDFPSSFPVVFETGERIPHKVDRHIYSDTGSCCLTTAAKAQIMLKTNIDSLSKFIIEIVIPYFMNNSYYELNGYYRTSEYSHNHLGIIEGYRDILQVSDDLKIAQLMDYRLQHKKLKIKDSCYCGSRKKLKKCKNGSHYQCYKKFRKIDLELLRFDFIIFQLFLRNKI